MNITSIETVPYSIPYVTPLKFSFGEVGVANHVLLRIHTSDGVVGTADIPPRPTTYGETQQSVVAIVRDIFGPQLEGKDPFNRELVQRIFANTVGNNATKGAIDVALWDIIGQSVGVSCHKLLGGYAPSMRVSHMLSIDTPEAMLDEAIRVRDEYGITVFKPKTGRDVDTDLAACRVLREGLGDSVEIGVDANHGWTVDEALDFIDRSREFRLSVIEEPCPAGDALGRRRIVSHSRLPVVADESTPALGDVSRELLSGGATGVNIKIARTGFTHSARILSLCAGLGVPVLIGNQIDTQLVTLASVAFGAAFPESSQRAGELSNFLNITDDLLADPIVITNGKIAVRNHPGLGTVINEEKLDRYRQDI